jgi:hypothetical protein
LLVANTQVKEKRKGTASGVPLQMVEVAALPLR